MSFDSMHPADTSPRRPLRAGMRKWLDRASEWLKPSLFISYAREDRELAEGLYAAVAARGFAPFLDTADTLTGERFEDVIIDRIRRADGVIAVLSTDAASSAWCQAELTQAHARNVPVVPVQRGNEPVTLPGPLGWVHRLHRATIQGTDDQAAVFERIAADVRAARSRRRRRIVRALFLAAGSIAIVGAGVAWAFRGLNALTREQARTEVMDTVTRAPRALPQERVASLAAPLLDDGPLRQRLDAVRGSPERSDITRLNALVVENALTTSRDPRNRWYVKDVDWTGASLRAARLSAMTFQTGSLRQLRFDDTYFAGVIWTSNVRLSGLRFLRSRFDGGAMFGPEATDVEFVNSHFTGTHLTLERFSHTRFASQVSDPRPGLITDEVGSFTNAVIERCVPAPDPGVVNLDTPGSQVVFEGIVFQDVRFRGAFPPEMFKSCSFQHCTLPPQLTAEALERHRNNVSDSLWVDSDPCPQN